MAKIMTGRSGFKVIVICTFELTYGQVISYLLLRDKEQQCEKFVMYENQ